jgi:hypothetical protein
MRCDEIFEKAERHSSTWFVRVPFAFLTWSHVAASGHLMNVDVAATSCNRS